MAAPSADQNGEMIRSGEIAALLGMKSPNVHVWLRRRGIKPVARDPKRGWRLYSREAIMQAREEFLRSGGGPGGHEADERRRATAVARRDAA